MLALSQATVAQNSPQLEEVVVTAQKRSANLQDVPISISVLSQDSLDNLNISDFGDYVQQIPSLSFTQRRPGEASLFMRGISEGGNGNQSLQGPSVAIYLDEQPVTAIGFNLDPHIYDVERIEVLKGPQGTLFGAASQAGTLRIITNKPSTDAFDAGFDLTAETISDGGDSYMAEGFVNVPMGDRAALRLTAWWDDDGGYIDAVEDTITYPLSGITRTNEAYREDDFNTAEKTGLRAALRVDLNDSWTANVAATYQENDIEGIWDHDPDELGDFKVSRFFEDNAKDEWTQFALTLEGDLGFADLTYAGSYLDRDYETYSDYSAYSIDGFVEPYYTCYVSYFGPCVDPSIQYSNLSEITSQTHELRLASSTDRIDWIVGAFYIETETDFDSRWSIPPINPGAAVIDDLYFQTDQVREDSEIAIFGELNYRFTDKLTGTVGYRWFDGETTLDGFVGTVFFPEGGFAFSPERPPDNVDSKYSGDDGTLKLSLSYDVSDDTMVYATFAEGYRPGGVNRAPGVGETYDPDFLDSYELGWKSTLMDGAWRFNGALYFMEWDDVQIGFFNPDISLLGLVDNVGSAESYGVEIDTTYLVTDNLELTLAYAYNKAELTDDYFARSDNTEPDAVDGQDLPFTPDNKFTVTGRYNFDLGAMPSAVQLNYTYTDSMYNDIFIANREEMDSYGLLSASFTIEGDGWHASLFGDNLTDEVAELYINSVDIRRLTTVNQPRTFGVSFGMRFD
ncbi:TonB-dependent receptor [Halioglobus pacificus]|uniref:TonB-dependent receptor n=1 Tax=Parahalioglobus pacificus TaxID=930806 RepID=A0A918XCH1_9GAMM|nr:TonB-dependent receptor [Halioglobus pacificus]NQY03455.1 TonB-dependent receptor [Halieaceae bacterium]GHD25323.1 TonB-dependent receptor [Halioglobus pacificus]